MWTWHSTVRRTSPVLTSTFITVCTPGTLTTAVTHQISGKGLAVQPPTQKQTRGGQSTLEWHCTSGASSSLTEKSVVVRIFLPHWLSQNYTKSLQRQLLSLSCCVLTCNRLLFAISYLLWLLTNLLVLQWLWICMSTFSTAAVSCDNTVWEFESLAYFRY